MPITLSINGQSRNFPELGSGATLAEVVAAMELKRDRVAVERNGEIVQRARWPETPMADGDRLEVVHFVGGGCDALPPGALGGSLRISGQ